MSEENIEMICESPALNATVDNVIGVFQNQEEEVQKLDQRKCNLEAEIDHLKRVGQFLEVEKAKIDDDIARLKVRNMSYQKEHTNLRNSITVVRFQIEKIKESIAVAKENDLKALEDFEKSVDEITEKFRSGPATYDRKILLERIEQGKEKRDALIEKLTEVRESYENFNKTHGLRARTDKNEELLSCVLPDSALACFIEMAKSLDEVISGIKNFTGDSKENGKKNLN